MATLLCPYCFSTFAPNELLFRCVDPGRCGTEDDILLTEYQFGKIARTADGRTLTPLLRDGRVFAAGTKAEKYKGIPRAAICPECGRESNKLICPACHNTLPFQFGWYDSCPIALIGAKFAGKSNYIGVVIRQLRQRVAPAFKAPLESLDDQTRERYRTYYEMPLFQQHEVVPQTISAVTFAQSKYPLSYRLKIERSGLLGRQQKMVDLSFFDTAGEDLLNSDIMNVHTRYIGHARGVIILLDPLQLPAVRAMLPPSIDLPDPNPYQDQIVERATQLIQTIQRLGPGQKIATPLAIAFSKVDALQQIVDGALLRNSDHPGYVNLSDIDHLHRLWRGYLNDWGFENLAIYLDSTYKQWRFFGVSALGGAPDEGRLPNGVNAFRVEDPILWLLFANNSIEGRYVKRP